MPFLRIGQVVIEVIDELAERWAALEDEAVAAAAARPHGRPSLWVRGDDRSVGTMSVIEGRRAIPDAGPATRSGTIVQASATHAGLDVSDLRDEDRSDEEIAEMVREMKAEHPHLDWENTLSGRLLGPASPDRPDFPVWEFEEAIQCDPSLRLADLTASRFPIRHADETVETKSVDEDLRPPPAHLQAPPRVRLHRDAHDVIGLYRALHEAGLLEWDPVERGLVRRGTIDDHRHAFETWFGTRQEEDGLPQP